MSKLRQVYIATFFACTLLLNSGSQAALVKYTYTGSVFTDVTGTAYEMGTDRITGHFVIDDADMISLGSSGTVVGVNSDVVSWSFDDGAGPGPWYSSSINDANGTLFAFAFHTDASGSIIDWDINVYVSSIYRWMDWCKRVGGSCSNSDTVVNRPSVYNNVASNELPGAWSGPTAYIPLPATAWLFLTALGGAIGLKHRAWLA